MSTAAMTVLLMRWTNQDLSLFGEGSYSSRGCFQRTARIGPLNWVGARAVTYILLFSFEFASFLRENVKKPAISRVISSHKDCHLNRFVENNLGATLIVNFDGSYHSQGYHSYSQTQEVATDFFFTGGAWFKGRSHLIYCLLGWTLILHSA